MMDKSDLRTYFLTRQNELQNYRLTQGQLRILKYVKKYGNIDTRRLTKLLDISTQSASSRLYELWRKGWLLRYEEEAETGGIEFIYLHGDE